MKQQQAKEPHFNGEFEDSGSENEDNPKKKTTLIMNVSDTQYDVVKFVGKKLFKWILQYDLDTNNWDMFWTDAAVQPETLGKMQPYQKINHFPGMYSLARKNHLGRNLMKMRKQFSEEYKFFPQTWLLPAEYGDFKNQFVKGKARTFIVKPEASCQGRGIFLTRNINDINPNDHYVAQRYMHRPFLIEGLKFDLRVYVLLAGTDPMRIYVYQDGLVRFATELYVPPNSSNLEDMCMHLTNYATPFHFIIFITKIILLIHFIIINKYFIQIFFYLFFSFYIQNNQIYQLYETILSSLNQQKNYLNTLWWSQTQYIKVRLLYCDINQIRNLNNFLIIDYLLYLLSVVQTYFHFYQELINTN